MKTILLVDDEPLLREVFAASLSQEHGGLSGDGHDVLTAENGMRAIELLGRRRVDLVVTDLCMPQVDGFALLAHLDAHYPKLPVVAMTGYGFPDAQAFVQNLGARVYLEKPVPLETLARTVEGLLDTVTQESCIYGFSLCSFLQMMELDKKTSLVRVQAGGGRAAQLYFDHGALVHAGILGAEGKQGPAAVVEMLGWREPQLRISNAFELPARNVAASLSTLLMESAHTLDERIADAEAARRRTVDAGGSAGVVLEHL